MGEDHLNNRGAVYENKGDLDRALSDYNKAIEINPKHADTHYNRGDVHRAKGELDRALADYTKAIEINPKHARAYNNRGVVYEKKSDLDRALADYNKAIEINPKYADAYNNRGHVHKAKGSFDKAIADYNKAIEVDPKNSDYVRSPGLLEYDRGDFKGAARDLLRALELKNDVYTMLYRYLAQSRMGEVAEAELEANAGRLKTKDWPYAVVELYLGKRPPAATLDAAPEPDERCEAHFYIGQWHLLKSNAADAETALKVAVETCPKDFVEYATAVAELKRLKR